MSNLLYLGTHRLEVGGQFYSDDPEVVDEGLEVSFWAYYSGDSTIPTITTTAPGVTITRLETKVLNSTDTWVLWNIGGIPRCDTPDEYDEETGEVILGKDEYSVSVPYSGVTTQVIPLTVYYIDWAVADVVPDLTPYNYILSQSGGSFGFTASFYPTWAIEEGVDEPTGSYGVVSLTPSMQLTASKVGQEYERVWDNQEEAWVDTGAVLSYWNITYPSQTAPNSGGLLFQVEDPYTEEINTTAALPVWVSTQAPPATPPTIDGVPGLLDVNPGGERKYMSVVYDMGTSGVATIDTPVSGASWVKVTEVGSESTGSTGIIKYYSASISPNSESYTRNTWIRWTVRSGSNYTASGRTNVYQDNIENGSISVNPGSATINANVTSSIFTASYVGLSLSESIVVPEVDTLGWTVEKVSGTESTNLVTIVWRVKGSVNSSYTAREVGVTVTYPLSGVPDGTFTLTQNGQGYEDPEVGGVPGLWDVAPRGQSQVVAVEYFRGSRGDGVVQAPTSASWITLTEESSSTNGNYVTKYYSASFQANNSSTERTANVVWSIKSGSYTSAKTTSVYQEAIGYSLTLTPSSNTISPNTTASFFTASYVGLTNSESISTPGTSDENWTVSKVGGRVITGLEDRVDIYWRVDGTPNTTSSPKNISVVVLFPNGAAASKTHLITQGAYEVGGVSVTGSTIGWNEPTGTFIVNYDKGTSGLISTPTVSQGSIVSSSLLASTSTTERWKYWVGIGNNTDYSGDRYVEGTFKLYQGPSATGYITQSRCAEFDPNVTVQSVYSVGGAGGTLRIPVTYSKSINPGFVQTPVTSSGISSVSTYWTLNYPDVVGSASVVIPANETNQAKSYMVRFSVKSGSVSASAITNINQSSGDVGASSITLPYSSTTIPYSQERIYLDVTYVGTTSQGDAITPSANVEGWSATAVDSNIVGNDVKITWLLTGTPNYASSARTISYVFSARGPASSKVLTITQNGMGSPSTTTLIRAWKDTNTAVGSGSSYVVTAVSGGNVLFKDTMYPEPGSSVLVVNFNRLAESYLEPREFVTSSTSTDLFTFTTVFNPDNVSYTYKVLDDWTFDENIGIDKYDLSYPYSKKAAKGQYLVYSVMRTAYTYPNDLEWVNPLGVTSSVSVESQKYTDAVTKVTECGTYTIRQKVGKAIINTWNVVSKDWVLYYYNSRGGWDSFVVCGPVIPSVTRQGLNYLHNRRSYKAYQVGITNRWLIKTGTLLDEEAKAVPEIVASPSVILHDLKNDVLIPVRPVDNTVEKKTFRNQGREFASYEFEVEENLNRIRR